MRRQVRQPAGRRTQGRGQFARAATLSCAPSVAISRLLVFITPHSLASPPLSLLFSTPLHSPPPPSSLIGRSDPIKPLHQPCPTQQQLSSRENKAHTNTSILRTLLAKCTHLSRLTTPSSHHLFLDRLSSSLVFSLHLASAIAKCSFRCPPWPSPASLRRS